MPPSGTTTHPAGLRVKANSLSNDTEGDTKTSKNQGKAASDKGEVVCEGPEAASRTHHLDSEPPKQGFATKHEQDARGRASLANTPHHKDVPPLPALVHDPSTPRSIHMLDQCNQPHRQAHPAKDKKHPLVKETREGSAKVHEHHARISKASNEGHDRIGLHVNDIVGDHPAPHKASLPLVSCSLSNKAERLSNGKHDEFAAATKEAERPQVPRGPPNTVTISITGAFRDKHHQRLEERSKWRPPSHHTDESIVHKVTPDSLTSSIAPIRDPIRPRRSAPATPTELFHPLAGKNPLRDQVMWNLLNVPSKTTPPASHRLLVSKHLRPVVVNGIRSRLITIKKPPMLINDLLKLDDRSTEGPGPPSPPELPPHVLPRIIKDPKVPIKLRLLLFNDRAMQNSDAPSDLIEPHTARGKINPLPKARPSSHCPPNTPTGHSSEQLGTTSKPNAAAPE